MESTYDVASEVGIFVGSFREFKRSLGKKLSVCERVEIRRGGELCCYATRLWCLEA